MTLRERLGLWLIQQRESRTLRSILTGFGGQAANTPDDYKNVALEVYKRNPAGFASLWIISTAFAGVPWKLFEKSASPRNKEKTELDSHPLLTLIERPNSKQGRSSFMQAWAGYTYLAGNSYVEAVSPDGGPNAGVPRELHNLRPDRTKVIPGAPGNPISHYEYKAKGKPTKIDPENMLHLKIFNPLDDWYGHPPAISAGRAIDINNEARKWHHNLLHNHARIPGIFTSKEPLSDEQFDRLNDQIKKFLAGADNAGKPLLADGNGLDWKPGALSPVDMDWLQGLQQSARDTAIVFRIPPELLGDPQSKQFASYREARKSLYTETVLPLLDWFRDELNAWLVPRFDDRLVLDYDVDKIEALQEDRDKKWKRSTTAFTNNVLKLDEARAELGYDSDPVYGDMYQWEIQAQSLGLTGGDDDSNGDEEEAQSGAVPVIRKGEQTFDADRQSLVLHTIDDRRNKWIVSVKRMVAKRFRSDAELLVKEIGKLRQPEDAPGRLDNVIGDLDDHWKKMLTAVYFTVGEDFGKLIWESVRSARDPLKLYAPQDQKDFPKGQWQRIVLEWVQHEAGEKIKQIRETTRLALRKSLKEGVAAGESILDLQKRVKKLVKEEIIPHRSEVIARTETIQASNLGSQAAARAADVPMEKVWIAARDSRTRDAHVSANGQRRPLDKPYNVSGELLMFPGDTSLGASAENTIQCRCTEGYEVLTDD